MVSPPTTSRSEELTKRLEEWRGHPEAVDGTVLSQDLFAAGSVDEAIDVARAAVAREPSQVAALVVLSRAFCSRGDAMSAELEARAALAVSPDDLAAQAALAEATALPNGRTSTNQTLAKVALAKQVMSVVEKSRPPKPRRTDPAELTPPPEEPPSLQVTAPVESTATPPSEPPKRAARSVASANVAVARPTAGRPGWSPGITRRKARWLLPIATAAGIAAAGMLWLGRERSAPEWHVPDEVKGRLALGRPSDFSFAEGELLHAPAGVALAALAEQRALALVEYAEGDPARVRAAITAAEDAEAAGRGTDTATLAVARAALAVAGIGPRPDAAALAVASLQVERAMVVTRRDPRSVYLDGILRARGGDRAGAMAALTQVDAGGRGPVRAGIALADLALDAGKLDQALAGYQHALARAPGHPRALVGRAHARAELRGITAEAVPGLLADLDQAARQLEGHGAAGPRLARAAVLLTFDPEAATKELEALSADAPRRELTWVGLMRAERGELAEVSRLRARVGDLGDPALVGLLDAELALERGAMDEALAAAGTRADPRGRLVRARALLDLGRVEQALVELTEARATAPDDRRLAAFEALARARAGGAHAESALVGLEEMARSDGLARLCLGEAKLARDDRAGAARSFREARSGNPLGYRARTRLAEMALDDLDVVDPRAALRSLQGVEPELRAALEQAPEHLPARALLGRYLLAVGQPEAAIAALTPVASAGRTHAVDDVAMATAFAALGDRKRAKLAARRALEKGAPMEELKQVARAIGDPALDEELGNR